MNNIKKIREGKKISQYDLAKDIDLKQSQISKIENGKRNLRNDEIIKISKALNVSVEDLFFRD